MKKQHMCHLTVLNPALHTRIFFKLALSQIDLGYTVTVIGQDARQKAFTHREVEIIPIRPFDRLGLRRLFVGWQLLILAKRTGADIFTLHTPELLWVGFLLKFLFRKKILYDVHEDYKANFINRKQHPGFLRKAIGSAIRIWEKLSAKWLDGIAYAEACYENMLAAKLEKTVLLRNSFTSRAIEGEPSVSIPSSYMLYTGTIAREWGIWETVDLWEKINESTPFHLVVAGFTYDKKLLQEISERIASSVMKDRFTLVGGSEYVAYTNIIHLIRNCTFGTAFYHPLPHIREKIPTKFYEFMACAKPLVFTRIPFWESLQTKWEFGLPLAIDIQNARVTDSFDLSDLPVSTVPQHIFSWEADEKKLTTWLTVITSGSGQKPR